MAKDIFGVIFHASSSALPHAALNALKLLPFGFLAVILDQVSAGNTSKIHPCAFQFGTHQTASAITNREVIVMT